MLRGLNHAEILALRRQHLNAPGAHGVNIASLIHFDSVQGILAADAIHVKEDRSLAQRSIRLDGITMPSTKRCGYCSIDLLYPLKLQQAPGQPESRATRAQRPGVQ